MNCRSINSLQNPPRWSKKGDVPVEFSIHHHHHTQPNRVDSLNKGNRDLLKNRIKAHLAFFCFPVPISRMEGAMRYEVGAFLFRLVLAFCLPRPGFELEAGFWFLVSSTVGGDCRIQKRHQSDHYLCSLDKPKQRSFISTILVPASAFFLLEFDSV